jgi:protein TonB
VFEEHPPHRRSYWILSGAVALLLLAGAVVWWTWHEPLAENTTSQMTAQPSATATEKAETVALRVLPLKPSATVVNQPGDRSSTKPPLQNAAKIETTGDANASRPGKRAVSEIRLPTHSGESSARLAAVGAAVDPPTVVLANMNGVGRISELASEPANLPTLDAKVSQGVTAPNLIHKVEPAYPREAFAQRLGGTVTLTASIAEDGAVREIKVLSGEPMLAEAAVAAVRQWRYSPCLLNGQPIAVEKPITIVFKTP